MGETESDRSFEIREGEKMRHGERWPGRGDEREGKGREGRAAIRPPELAVLNQELFPYIRTDTVEVKGA